MMRPAPYSQEVRSALEAGRTPAVHVFAGPDAWHRAEDRRRKYGPGTALVLPSSELPETFVWPPVVPEAVVISAMPTRHRVSLEMRLRAVCARTK